MHLIDHCPCCKAPVSDGWPGLVSPFIAEFVLQAPVGLCRLCECPSCGFRFFDPRYDEAELARLYGGYRGVAYFEARHHHEFWYTRRHNDHYTEGQEGTRARQRFLMAFLHAHLEGAKLRSVLDYGGDAGQLLPPELGQERHVFEVSDVVPVAGVTRIAREADLVPGSYDLVILSHVLEHVPDPAALLTRLRPLLRPVTGALYVEVPWERYSLRWSGRGPRCERRLRWLARHPRLLQWSDFYGTAFRHLLGFVPPGGFPKLHEHINFFTPEALDRAFGLAGLRLGAWEQGRLPKASGSVPVLMALAFPG